MNEKPDGGDDSSPPSPREIARMLHDVVGQGMSQVLLELEMLDHATSDEELGRVMQSIQARINAVADDMGRVASNLPRSDVGELGEHPRDSEPTLRVIPGGDES